MATNATVDLRNFTPEIIKSQDLWGDFLDTVSDELDLMRVEIEKKNRLFEVELYDDVYELINIARSLGYKPNLIIREDLDYVRQEVESIVFKIKNKATYSYYNYLFKLIPKKGTVYILFQDYLTLVRAIDWSTTFTNLFTHDITKPFSNVESILHYDEYQDKPVELDALILFYLDSIEKWYLDQDIVIKPTQHLAIEYQIDELLQNDNNEDVLMRADYLAYMKEGVNYGRKVTNVPHVGFNVSFLMGEQGFFDTFSDDENYSIPDLKIACSVTDGYKDSIPQDLIYLDDTPQSNLDEEPYWSLDQETEIVITKTLEERFKYIAVGTGDKSLFSKNYLSLVTDLNIHMSFEDKHTTSFEDNAINNYTANASGSFTLEQGISGKTVNYNGTDTELVVNDFVSSSSDKDINFWIIPESTGQVDTDPRFIYQSGYIDVFYNTSNETIDCIFTGDSSSITAQSNTITTNDFNTNTYFVSIKIDSDSDELSLYIDNTIQGSAVDISGIGLYNSSEDLYFGSKNGLNFFTGKIDEFRIYGKNLIDSDRQYLFDKHLGSLRYLDNEVFRKEISTNQINSSSNWNGVVGTIPANTTNNERIAVGDGTTKHFTGTLDYTNLYPGYLTMEYYSFPNWYHVTTNDKGEFVGDAITGTINYVDGTYDFITEKEIQILYELISHNTSESSLNYGMNHSNIVPETTHLVYSISDTNYDVVDIDNLDGTGSFPVADGITASTITYATGHIEVTFSPTSTDSDSDVYTYYSYIADSTPSANSELLVEYKLIDSLEITEAAIINEQGEVSIYATFPKSEFDSILNHIGLNFFVRKLSS